MRTKDWETLIRLVEKKVDRLRVETGQLEWLVADFRRQAKEGKACPLMIANQRIDFTELLDGKK